MLEESNYDSLDTVSLFKDAIVETFYCIFDTAPITGAYTMLVVSIISTVDTLNIPLVVSKRSSSFVETRRDNFVRIVTRAFGAKVQDDFCSEPFVRHHANMRRFHSVQ